MRACEPSTGPTACALAGRRCSLWAWWKGVPGGGAFHRVVWGAWCQALSLPRPPVLWSGPPGSRVPRVPGAVDAGVWTQHQPHSVRPCGPALFAVGVAEGRLRGGAFRRCEGRLVSGAVPPLTARPPERAARVPRPVCPGCGRCGRVDPAAAPQRAPLRAGVARCGGGGRASPGGVPSTVVRGAWCQALSLPRPPVLWSGQPGFRDPCVPGAVDAGVWTQHRPHSVRPCGPALLAVGVAEGRPRGGCLPPCCGGRLVSGAVPPPTARPQERAAGVPRPVCPGCGRCGRVSPAPAPQRAPLRAGVAHCGGGGRASPGGVPSTVLCGAPGVRRCPSPGRPSSGAGRQGPASRVSRVRSMRACGPSTGPTACALAGRRCSLWGWRRGVSGGGGFRRCEGRLVSGAVPPLTARPPERAARVPRPVCPGCGRCGRVDLAAAPQRAPLRAGVARCGGGGRASPGGVPSTVVRGAWCQALSLPRPPVLWSGQPGFRDPCVPGAVDAGVWTPHRPHSVRPCGPALLAVGVAEGRPRGGCLPPL